MKPTFRASAWGYRLALAILFLTNTVALAWVARTQLAPGDTPPDALVQSAAITVTATRSATPTSRPTATQTAIPISLQGPDTPEEALRAQGLLILSLRDGHFNHLFAYHPLHLPLTRLTQHPWDDVAPALDPGGTRLAYASRQNGYWDLYLLDLQTGEQQRLTDTPEYEGAPTWSPDGAWIAYERYNGASLDIYLQPVEEGQGAEIRLTDHPGIDRAPAWSPGGRDIAFVSSRSGDEEIWLARLDSIDERFINISRSPLARDRFPLWSPDGSRLAWTAENSGDRRLAIWDAGRPDMPARLVGEGDRLAWSPDGSLLFSDVRGPNQTGLAAYTTDQGRMALPLTPLPGVLNGMVWVPGPLPAWLEAQAYAGERAAHPPLYQPALTLTVAPAGRAGLVALEDVTAPQALLQDAVDEAFLALRAQVGLEAGWDALSSLENAYIPLTTPPTPSIQDDWLYTGRAIALNPLLLSAGWMTMVRESYAGQTFWRVYLRARYQDGSMGEPLAEMIWDLNARYDGDPRAYEQGGRLGQVPSGYWIDLTEITGRFGWERLPSSINWRTFYPSIRANQFVITGGLEWKQAMSELYPPEALATSTPQPTATRTGVPTLIATLPPTTATPVPTMTQVATRRPTWTPLPGQSLP